jgi:hypothetical protein
MLKYNSDFIVSFKFPFTLHILLGWLLHSTLIIQCYRFGLSIFNWSFCSHLYQIFIVCHWIIRSFLLSTIGIRISLHIVRYYLLKHTLPICRSQTILHSHWWHLLLTIFDFLWAPDHLPIMNVYFWHLHLTLRE